VPCRSSVGPGGLLPLAGVRGAPPAAWRVVTVGEGVQMTGDHLEVAADPEAVSLGHADVPEMLALVARTKPGPFLPRTFELGSYLGVRRDSRLVAMAGERLHPEGWTEIGAVCTDEAWRGQGLASRLIRAVGGGSGREATCRSCTRLPRTRRSGCISTGSTRTAA
jgi:GNAT superfamily N-acetyltransferase